MPGFVFQFLWVCISTKAGYHHRIRPMPQSLSVIPAFQNMKRKQEGRKRVKEWEHPTGWSHYLRNLRDRNIVIGEKSGTDQEPVFPHFLVCFWKLQIGTLIPVGLTHRVVAKMADEAR